MRNQEVSGRFTLQSCKTTAKKCTKKVKCSARAKLFFFAYEIYCCFFTVLVAFAPKLYTILYLVWANYKYYRELRF